MQHTSPNVSRHFSSVESLDQTSTYACPHSPDRLCLPFHGSIIVWDPFSFFSNRRAPLRQSATQHISPGYFDRKSRAIEGHNDRNATIDNSKYMLGVVFFTLSYVFFAFLSFTTEFEEVLNSGSNSIEKNRGLEERKKSWQENGNGNVFLESSDTT